MLKKTAFYLLISFFLFLQSCYVKKVKPEEVLDTSTIKIIYKTPDNNSCTFLGEIKETGFDLKTTKELAYEKALKMDATHVYVYLVSTAFTDVAKEDKINSFAVSGEVFLIKAKAYKCSNE
jgi:hypothetical protein